MADHRPTLVHFGDKHTVPAEVCWGCSNEEEGVWVPVTQCPIAKSEMTKGPGSLYADVVILHRENDETEGEDSDQ